MSKLITYSLVIPIYNSEEKLCYLFNSILKQKLNFNELILINNNSKDNTLLLLREFKTKYDTQFTSGIKIIDLSYNNISKSRNIGIKLATSEFILFIDSDDYLSEDYLFFIDQSISNACYKYYDFYEFNFINRYFNGKLVVNDYFLPSREYGGKEYLKTVIRCFKEQSKFMCWKYVYNRKFLMKHKIYFDEDINLLEDLDFIFRCMQKNPKILVFKKKEIVYYIQNHNSLTNKREKDKYYDSFLYISNKEYFKEYKYYFLNLSIKVLSLKNFLKLSSKFNKNSPLSNIAVYIKKRVLLNKFSKIQ